MCLEDSTPMRPLLLKGAITEEFRPSKDEPLLRRIALSLLARIAHNKQLTWLIALIYSVAGTLGNDDEPVSRPGVKFLRPTHNLILSVFSTHAHY